MALSEYTRNTAITIINQLGGSARLNMMIGLKKVLGAPFLVDEKENSNVRLQFDFKACNVPNIKRVVITYIESSDTYDMELWKGLSEKQLLTTINWSPEKLAEKFRVAHFENVYCDQLVELFEDSTGLTLQVPDLLTSGMTESRQYS